MHQFSAVDEGDLEDGCDCDGELGPFYDVADGVVQNLEDAEPQVEPVDEVEPLINLSFMEASTKVATELSNIPSNEAEMLVMTVVQLKEDLESKKTFKTRK